VPIARHARGFPQLVAGLLVIALAAVVFLWLSFSIDYSTTRDVYFTIAIAHVLAEAPFLLRMI
jgi:multidrug resistance efflux pump